MRYLKQIVPMALFAMLMIGIACACSSDIDIRQNYEFKVTHLPVPKRLKVGESAEIRCQIEREGKYEPTTYRLRYFQPDGKGMLSLDDGTIFLPNDYYDLDRETFRLYYTSNSEDQQVIDIYFFDSFNNSFYLTFAFNNEQGEEEEG